ncbi:MAG: PGF-CTERM sorting domain-containing protein [Halobacteriota archaeon]
METRRKGKEIIGIAMAAIMVVSVLAVAMPMVGAESKTDNFNHIVKQTAAQKVLIGQNLQFEGFDGTVTISRLVSGDVENVYQTDANNRIYNVNWPTSGAYYVNYDGNVIPATSEAQLSVEEPNMPLKLKVGTKEVSSIALKTKLTIDTGGMNLFPEDQVDLVVIGPDGQMKYDDVNDQKFTDITVAQLNDKYGDNNLETTGWTIGAYTFKVTTDDVNACGLKVESVVRPLAILKGEIAIEADTTSTVELDTVKLIVTGVANDEINVAASPLSDDVTFKAGIDDTPMGATDQFDDTIDADGTRKYAVEFTDTGSYTLKVTVTGPADIGGIANPRVGDSDTVDITVLEKEVAFDLPSTVVIGDKVTIIGTATSGTYVSVYVDDVLYKKLENMVLVDGEFSQEVTTTDAGMNVPGSVRLKAWINCLTVAGEARPTRSPDGEDAILLTTPSLTAELSADAVALEDDFTAFGTAQGATEVTILSVPPKGGGGKSLLDKGATGLSLRKASVSTTDYMYSKKMTVQEDATTGYYDEYVLTPGMDGYWGMTGEKDINVAFEKKYGINDLSGPSIATKTQTEIQDILEDMIYAPGSDDLMVKLRLKAETPYVWLHPVADVNAPAPLEVGGTSNRKDGYTIVITCIGVTAELAPQTVQVENTTFRATFDTTGAVTGEYTVKADDGDGHVAEEGTFITGTGVQKIEEDIEKAVEKIEEVVEKITATPVPTPTPTPAPTPEPTPEPPGFEAIFAIAGLLAVAYLVHRRKH